MLTHSNKFGLVIVSINEFTKFHKDMIIFIIYVNITLHKIMYNYQILFIVIALTELADILFLYFPGLSYPSFLLYYFSYHPYFWSDN